MSYSSKQVKGGKPATTQQSWVDRVAAEAMRDVPEGPSYN